MNGKKLVFAAAIGLMVLVSVRPALADAVTADASRLNIRSEASSNSRSVMTVNRGDEMRFICGTDNWVMVEADGKTGYVMEKYVEIDAQKLLGDVAQSLNSYSSEKAGYAATRVYLREMPTKDSDSLVTVPARANVTLLGECGDWYRASYNGQTGYLMKEYVTAATVAPALQTTAAVGTKGETTARVNLRASASKNGKVVKVIAKGAAVTVSGQSGDWYKVVSGGSTGYIAKDYVEMESVSVQVAASSEKTYSASVKATATTRVNLRASADEDSKSLDKIEKNESVTVLGESGNWYRVSFGGKTGYVSKAYLKLSTAETASSSSEKTYSAGVKATATTRVNLRTYADEDSKSLDKIERNESVTVLGESGSWYKVNFGGKTGYAAKAYLKLIGTAEATGSYSKWNGVTEVDVNMRKEPEGEVQRVLKAGTTVTVIGKIGSWYQVTYLNSTGYVAGSYVAEKTTAAQPAAQTQTTVKTDARDAWVIGGNVNMRKGPGTGYGTVKTLAAGTKLTAYEKADGWYRVLCNGAAGYISEKYVTLNDPGIAPAQVGGQTTRSGNKTVINSDWWTGEIQSVFTRGSVATVTDVDTGMSFQVKRTGGTNHADGQPLTASDTATMKKIYGGTWSWDRRAIWITVGDKNFAASMNGMPHGDSDSMPDNNFDGCFCMHFLNSRTHAGNRLDAAHQAAVKKAYTTPMP